jgi:3-methyladenine DNA glycosylase AlkD
MSLTTIRAELRECASPAKAASLQWFFKTGPGEYGEGDVFLGVSVPRIRILARTHRNLPLDACISLLCSAYHEERLLALFLLVGKYDQADVKIRAHIFRAYLQNIRHVNNWDLVDGSAPHIIGRHLQDRSRRLLYSLARSRPLWKRRIAIMATFHYVRQEDYADTLAIADLLMAAREDLIHKAVGWMLREVGNRCLKTAEAFLAPRCRTMPRTMLRYAIEKFPEPKRQRYLRGAA